MRSLLQDPKVQDLTPLNVRFVRVQNQLVDMQTELEVLTAGMEDRTAQIAEANSSRDFAEVEVRPT